MTNINTPDDSHEVEIIDLTAPRKTRRVSDDVQQLKERLLEVQRELWATQAKVLGPGTVRFVGRVAAVELTKSGTQAMVTLVVPDEGERHQALRLRAKVAEVANMWIGAEVTLTATWRFGRLTLIEVEDLREVDEPMPVVPVVEKKATEGSVPDWLDSKAVNAARDLLKASDGSSSVSDLKLHIVFCTKRRGKVLTGAMVDRFKALAAEVIAEKGLGKLLAANAEADHAHLALHLPVSVSASEAAGAIKAYTARLLRREYPELRAHDSESLWQRGFYAGAIGRGGDLSTVLAYINEQQAAPSE